MNRKRKRAVMLSVVTAVLLVGLLAGPGFALTIPPVPGDPAWDEETRTYTLAGDVYETILITQGMLTLDGNDFTVMPASGHGVTIPGKVGVVVTNLNIDGAPLFGILLSSNANNCEVVGNTISNCLAGIYLYGGHDNIVSENTVFRNYRGIDFNDVSYENIVSENIILCNNYYGMSFMANSNGITAYNNDLIGHESQVESSGNPDNIIYSLDPPIGGNYWDDWAALYDDSDGDGFLDEPRINLPGSTEGDQLPLANMYLIRFFDDCVDAGTITASTDKPKPAAKRLTSFRDKLVGAQVLIEAGDYASACEELDKVLNACDGIRPPPDLVMGEDIGTLVDMIETLKIALGCE